jgi:hypothetical protein
MLWLMKLLLPLLGSIAGGPVLEIIDKLVVDRGLKERLKAEIRRNVSNSTGC